MLLLYLHQIHFHQTGNVYKLHFYVLYGIRSMKVAQTVIGTKMKTKSNILILKKMIVRMWMQDTIFHSISPHSELVYFQFGMLINLD